MSLVEDDGRISFKTRVVHGFSKKHTVRHVLEERCARLRHVFETDGVTNLSSQLYCESVRSA